MHVINIVFNSLITEKNKKKQKKANYQNSNELLLYLEHFNIQYLFNNN